MDLSCFRTRKRYFCTASSIVDVLGSYMYIMWDGVTMHAHTSVFFSRVLSLLYIRKTNVALSLTQTVHNSGPRDEFVGNRGRLNHFSVLIILLSLFSDIFL